MHPLLYALVGRRVDLLHLSMPVLFKTTCVTVESPSTTSSTIILYRCIFFLQVMGPIKVERVTFAVCQKAYAVGFIGEWMDVGQ